MYHQHFGMHTDPFPLSPRLAFVFQSRAFGEAMAHLVYGIEQSEDIVLVSGGIGTGKTLALQSLLAQLSRSLQPVLVNMTRLTFPELLKYILLELDCDVPGQPDVPELLLRLKRELKERRGAGRKVLLIIDEAQNLDPVTLESVRLLLNLSPPEQQSLQLVLVGQPLLERMIAAPDLAQLSQRIRVRYRLEPLTAEEVDAYLHHRTRVAGCDRRLFTKGAVERISRYSQGIPRVVNILAERALLAAYVAGKPQVDAEHVRASDLPVNDQGEPSTEPASRRVPEPTPKPAPEPPPGFPSATGPRGLGGAGASPPAGAVRSGPVATVVGLPDRDFAAEGDRARERERSGGRRLVRAAMLGLLALALLAVIWWQWPAVRRTIEPETGRADTAPVTPLEPMLAEALPAGSASGGEQGEPGAAVAAAAAAEPTPAVAAAARIAVHVASFRTVERAETLVAAMAKNGYPAFTMVADLDGEPWIRVYVGPFTDRQTAQGTEDRLRAEGMIAYTQLVNLESR
ncbi:MAG: AAA family ATPase [Candidatus Krumholzibacteriia bacterium]